MSILKQTILYAAVSLVTTSLCASAMTQQPAKRIDLSQALGKPFDAYEKVLGKHVSEFKGDGDSTHRPSRTYKPKVAGIKEIVVYQATDWEYPRRISVFFDKKVVKSWNNGLPLVGIDPKPIRKDGDSPYYELAGAKQGLELWWHEVDSEVKDPELDISVG